MPQPAPEFVPHPIFFEWDPAVSCHRRLGVAQIFATPNPAWGRMFPGLSQFRVSAVGKIEQVPDTYWVGIRYLTKVDGKLR